ncbi:MAG: hypothetical protein ACLT16_14345 [[Clostridium] innocuum]
MLLNQQEDDWVAKITGVEVMVLRAQSFHREKDVRLLYRALLSLRRRIRTVHQL